MKNIYDEQYQQENYYWGLKPSIMCHRVLEKHPPIKKLRLLDIGCGEGKDAVFFARNGYDVTALDAAEAGVEKTKRLADKIGVSINVFKADVNEFRLESEFDILYSNGEQGEEIVFDCMSSGIPHKHAMNRIMARRV